LGIRQGRPFDTALGQHAENMLALFAPLYLGNGLAHQIGNNGALILPAKYLVKLGFDIVRHAEIYRGHVQLPIVEKFNKRMIRRIEDPSKGISRRNSSNCRVGA
jgi:hypothetical protein